MIFLTPILINAEFQLKLQNQDQDLTLSYKQQGKGQAGGFDDLAEGLFSLKQSVTC